MGTVNVPFSRVWRAVVAEFIATAFFVFFVAGSVQTPTIVSSTSSIPVSPANFVITGFTQGLAILCLVATVANISGGHLNPAVTACLMVVRNMPFLTGCMYIVAQILGGIVGAAFYKACLMSNAGTLGSTVASDVMNPFRTILTEFFITSMLLFVVLGTAVHAGTRHTGIKPLAPIPIGFAIAIGVFLAGPLTGASMNPARSFGPAVVSGTWKWHYAYWVGPLVASLVVGCLYKIIFLSSPITMDQARAAGIDVGNPSSATLEGDHLAPGTMHWQGGRSISEAEFIARGASDEHVVEIPPQHTEMRTSA
ncbi:aquaporin-like protein [Phlyctochytrium arcticum]|nr:aquaporin-like protein [Phlyctochytrium arcticum]